MSEVKKYIPNFNTFADACDRLAVTVAKLSYFENEKRKESMRSSPDHKMITYWDRLSRNECEYRNLLKGEINRILSEIVITGEYEVLEDNRTFLPPPKSVSELLEEMYSKADEKARAELAEALRWELGL